MFDFEQLILTWLVILTGAVFYLAYKLNCIYKIVLNDDGLTKATLAALGDLEQEVGDMQEEIEEMKAGRQVQ
jgi:hypothetical protein